MDLHKENDRKGLVGTIFIHIILFLLLLIWTVGQATEMLEEQDAVEVSFGDPFSGGDDAISEVAETNPTPPTEPNQVNNPNQTENTPQTDDPVVTNDQEEAPEVNTSSTPSTSETKPREPAKIDPKLQERLDKIKRDRENAKNNTNAGGGNDDKPGGNEDANNPGPGGQNQGTSGEGMSWNLHGFAVADWPDIKNTSQDAGKVVVEICLNIDGSIERLNIGPGTTTSSLYLRNLTLSSVRKFTFKAKGGQKSLNCGTITMVYKKT